MFFNFKWEGGYESFGMGLGWALQVEFTNISNFTNISSSMSFCEGVVTF